MARDLFAQQNQGRNLFDAQEPQQEDSILDTIKGEAIGAAETIGTLASGAIAEPVAGLRGIYEQVTGGDGEKAIKETREALTYEPRTKEGKRNIKEAAEFLQPVGEAISSAETFLGDTVFDATGSPALAATAATLPVAALELIGIKGSRGLTGAPTTPKAKEVRKAVLDSAPEIEAIKNASRAVYKEIDDSGATVKSGAVDSLINKIERETRKKGLDPRVTAKAAGALDVMKDSKGSNQPITELDVLREVAQNVAGSTDASEKLLGNIMIDEIDDFMSRLTPRDMAKGSESLASTGKKYETARKLWGRAKRSEMIKDAIEIGEGRAAGAEAGIRNELYRLITNKKKAKFIPESEKKLIREVVEGDFKQNFSRLVGKTGISIDRSPGVFQAMMAGGSAGLGGLFGLGAGGIVIPAVGTVSKRVAQNLTRNKAKFLDSITRAGNDAEAIAKAYLSAVPKSKRSMDDLSDLLSDPNLNIDELLETSNKIVRDAAEAAKGKRAIQLGIAQLIGSGAQATKQDEQLEEQ